VDEKVFADDFDEKKGEHENGKIWSATLWDIRQMLGRTTADTLIIESHFQQDGFTTFVRAARAILDSDRTLYGGRHSRRLQRIFRQHRIGPLTGSAGAARRGRMSGRRATR
jgi:hypothetical protein